MYLECIKDIEDYDIHKGSLWRVLDTFPKVYYIEVKNCADNKRFIINEKWSFHFKFIG